MTITWFRNTISGQVFSADEHWARIYRAEKSNEEIPAPDENETETPSSPEGEEGDPGETSAEAEAETGNADGADTSESQSTEPAQPRKRSKNV